VPRVIGESKVLWKHLVALPLYPPQAVRGLALQADKRYSWYAVLSTRAQNLQCEELWLVSCLYASSGGAWGSPFLQPQKRTEYSGEK
jgi:hypothetical protein